MSWQYHIVGRWKCPYGKLCKAWRVVKTCLCHALWLDLPISTSGCITKYLITIVAKYLSQVDPMHSLVFRNFRPYVSISHALLRNEMIETRRRIIADFPLYNTMNPIERSGSLIERSWTSAQSAFNTTIDKQVKPGNIYRCRSII